MAGLLTKTVACGGLVSFPGEVSTKRRATFGTISRLFVLYSFANWANKMLLLLAHCAMAICRARQLWVVRRVVEELPPQPGMGLRFTPAVDPEIPETPGTTGTVNTSAGENCDGSAGTCPAGSACQSDCTCSSGIVIPTVSQWGIASMALLLLVGGRVYFRLRRAMRT